VDRVTTDCIEIAKYIKERISPQLYLLGHSLGTYIALQAAHRKPDLASGCILISQYAGQKEAQTVAIEKLHAIAQEGQDSSLSMYLESIYTLPMTSLSDIV
jgi:pimeloyl-ACP methyl ester carboxylesterase